MEIAPDFFDYFEATASILDKDEYALLQFSHCILKWLLHRVIICSLLFYCSPMVCDVGRLWLFLLGMTMGKCSLCMIQVMSINMHLISFFFPFKISFKKIWKLLVDGNIEFLFELLFYMLCRNSLPFRFLSRPWMDADKIHMEWIITKVA